MEQSKIMKTYNCLYGNNKVVTSNGNYDIADLCDDSVDVYTINKKGSVSVSDDRFVKNTKMSNECIDIELEDGTVVSVTPEHKMMLADGTYKEAQYLTEDDILMERIDENNVFDISIWEQFGIRSYKWLNIYLQFMRNVYNRDISNLDCVEKHHVLPKSFMLNDFYVYLTEREYRIASRLLRHIFSNDKQSDAHIKDLNNYLNYTSIGNICICKDDCKKIVKVEDLDLYLSDGYVISDNVSVVNRNGNIHFVNSDELDYYLSDGYNLGTGLNYTDSMMTVKKNDNCYTISARNLYYYIDNGYVPYIKKGDICEN